MNHFGLKNLLSLKKKMKEAILKVTHILDIEYVLGEEVFWISDILKKAVEYNGKV